MKIRNLTVQGFRGFNKIQSIDFHDRLTLIYGPNSYGKTSISESFEWLLYGLTSKVENAPSIAEFKGSYRNRHFPSSETPFVRLRFSTCSGDLVFTSEHFSPDEFQKFVGEDDKKIKIDFWPLEQELYDIPKPFILQHALQNLLMAKPGERFQGFTTLIGFDVLDEMQTNVISFCTKPKLPNEVVSLRNKVGVLLENLESHDNLSPITKEFRKKKRSYNGIFEVVFSECRTRIPPETPADSILPQLLFFREEEVSKIYKGNIPELEFSEIELKSNKEDEEYFLTFLTDDFINDYSSLIALSTFQEIIDQERFFGLGISLLRKDPKRCPFCSKSLDDPIIQHIEHEHSELIERSSTAKTLRSKRKEVATSIQDLSERFKTYNSKMSSKLSSFLEIEPALKTLEKIFSSKNKTHLLSITKALKAMKVPSPTLQKQFQNTSQILTSIENSIEKSEEDSKLMKSFSKGITEYLGVCRAINDLFIQHGEPVRESDKVLQHELDALAGTQDVSILIDLLEIQADIKKYLGIEQIISELSELRSKFDTFVADEILQSIATELTDDVMHWYNKIKTTGDPDVHFDGFDLEKTKAGKVKSRRVQIKASSYGEELVSAISSLSESKLNVLGLCMSLATHIKSDSPFEFILIDDPIQSLDSEHETQFIEIIQDLVDSFEIQLIILSHNKAWLNQVCAGCRRINGWYYEITGYTKEGPNIVQISWARWKDRLKLVDAIIKDSTADTLKLQHAEAEIRLVVCSLTSELYKKKRNKSVNPNTLNSMKIQKILTECGVTASLVDRVVQTFVTTDDSHHGINDYEPIRERIKRYHAWAHELSKHL